MGQEGACKPRENRLVLGSIWAEIDAFESQLFILCFASILLDVQWLSMVWDKIPMIWDIIDLANYSLDLHVDMTKFDLHKNSNAGDTKK